jgi:hypothetical protein
LVVFVEVFVGLTELLGFVFLKVGCGGCGGCCGGCCWVQIISGTYSFGLQTGFKVIVKSGIVRTRGLKLT